MILMIFIWLVNVKTFNAGVDRKKNGAEKDETNL